MLNQGLSFAPGHHKIKWGYCALPALALLALACNLKKEPPVEPPQIPYPANEVAPVIQARVDSSEYTWFTDVKATASAFCNDQMNVEKPVSTSDVVILGEGLFHAKVEVHLPAKILILTMERLYKEKGKNSIWQIVKLEEKSWPESKSK